MKIFALFHKTFLAKQNTAGEMLIRSDQIKPLSSVLRIQAVQHLPLDSDEIDSISRYNKSEKVKKSGIKT